MKKPIILIIALACATLLKLYLSLTTEGSLDTAGFLEQLQNIRTHGVGVYHVYGVFGNPFNHPPPMIHALRGLGWLTDTTGLAFRFWLRLPAIIADIGIVLIVWHWLTRLRFANTTAVILALILCPTAIVISGYHGNTDPVMIFFVLLSLYLIETDRPIVLAGLAFGLALCIKVVPACFRSCNLLLPAGAKAH